MCTGVPPIATVVYSKGFRKTYLGLPFPFHERSPVNVILFVLVQNLQRMEAEYSIFVSARQSCEDIQTIDEVMIQVVYYWSPSRQRQEK